MHHHHPPTTSVTGTATSHQRRRKKRPNYGTRTVEVQRGYKGFGFTISGQQPCRLSCIVSNSPADQAGLRSGDFLISVNGLNVSKLPHETVVQLIGNSFGSIRMQIAENYYSDSSDEENAAMLLQQQVAIGGVMGTQLGMGIGAVNNGSAAMGGVRVKPRYLHHKTKMHRLRNSPQKKRFQQLHLQPPQESNNPVSSNNCTNNVKQEALRPLLEDAPLQMPNSTATSANTNGNATGNGNSDVTNVSAMVRVHVSSAELEYRAIVGYLGTIEMPKQISHSSKLQTVRSCIRKLRQEKRQPTTVLMTILPNSLRLQAANGNVLANYSSARLNYVSSSSETENRFFGLVTSAVHTSQADDEDEEEDIEQDEPRRRDLSMVAGGSCNSTGHISISNSCHVFVIDTKLCEHQAHVQRAAEFRISCTRDCISNLCLEFPSNSEYVVNLIRSMYTMRILPPATHHIGAVEELHANGGLGAGGIAAHSPQPSNHSEISTTTSNSDSGIGFHNDCANIADRIVVVDFPGVPELRMRAPGARPMAIFNSFDIINAATEKRLTVRAMPDPKSSPVNAQMRPNLLANFSLIKSPAAASSLTTTRSCDDVLSLLERTAADIQQQHQLQQQQSIVGHASMDDISLHSATTSTTMGDMEQHQFLHPSLFAISNSKKSSSDTYALLQDYRSGTRRSMHSAVPSKLSPQVFALNNNNNKPNTVNQSTETDLQMHSLGFQAVDFAPTLTENNSMARAGSLELSIWSSLQNLHSTPNKNGSNTALTNLESTYSEPDLGNRVVPTANASPFSRAWVHSSFRTPRTDKFAVHAHNQQTSPHKAQGALVRRTASMTASDNDVYIKSMDDFIDELKQTHSQQQIDSFGRIEQIMPSKIGNSNISVNRSGSGCSSTTNNNTKKSISNKLLPQIKVIETAGQAQSDATLEGSAGVRAWGTSFERLLEDSAGLHTFAEFLKKEFSAENIYFWTACERFRSLEDPAERVAQAQFIYAKHLGNGASEPVNVDSQARNLNEEKLQAAELDIFAPAQKQIFNLMKFDSYQRFIRSDLYKSCLDAEEKHQPLPYGADDLDELLRTHSQQGAASKLKKSASNAEDRRRKSLLPWHRKTRSKSRDGAEGTLAKPTVPVKHNPKAHLSSSSLKIPATSQHSGSDVHSSRSSLSSFDSAFPSSAAGVSSHLTAAADAACSLCRVILSDGATTIVQTRLGETVAELIERLLEKRGLNYKFYNVVDSETGKSIELQRAAMTLAGKQVLIEQGVAFKLDLPDPKVISVKSKPKKQLHEVIRPILHKYNYTMDTVQVLRRDTQLPLDLSLPVTVADGQRLQIVLLKQPATVADYQNGGCTAKYIKPAAGFANVGLKHTTRSTTGQAAAAAAAHQNTLDEITNKVFNELLQGKVQSHNMSSVPANDLCSIKSDDCGSENSSIFERMRRREVNVSGFKLKSKKKSTSSQQSEESSMTNASLAMPAPALAVDVKKPIIAKLKAGVRLQVTERVAENQDELLEGLKRAQLARLEDQRGTEINFELPDFLKNKENQLSAAASKLRKLRANLSPITKTNPNLTPTDEAPPSPSPFALMTGERPQPAPRLSIANRNKVAAALMSPMKMDEPASDEAMLETADYLATTIGGAKGPPPLPPKPKVLPIKPNNWGVCSANNSANTTPTNATNALLSTPTTPTASVPAAALSIAGKLTTTDATAASPRCAYLEEPSSSFV